MRASLKVRTHSLVIVCNHYFIFDCLMWCCVTLWHARTCRLLKRLVDQLYLQYRVVTCACMICAPNLLTYLDSIYGGLLSIDLPTSHTLHLSGGRQLTPRQFTPRQLTPRQLTPRKLTPRQLTPRQCNLIQ